MAADPTVRAEVLYEGHVQGVGFRFTVQSLARHCDVTGYVQNLPAGRVCLVAEGPRAEVDSLVTEVARRMEGYIQHQDRRDSPARGEFSDFAIRH